MRKRPCWSCHGWRGRLIDARFQTIERRRGHRSRDRLHALRPRRGLRVLRFWPRSQGPVKARALRAERLSQRHLRSNSVSFASPNEQKTTGRLDRWRSLSGPPTQLWLTLFMSLRAVCTQSLGPRKPKPCGHVKLPFTRLGKYPTALVKEVFR